MTPPTIPPSRLNGNDTVTAEPNSRTAAFEPFAAEQWERTSVLL